MKEKTSRKKSLEGIAVTIGIVAFSLATIWLLSSVVESKIGLKLSDSETTAVVAKVNNMASDTTYVLSIETEDSFIDIAVIADTGLYEAGELITVGYDYWRGYMNFWDAESKEAWKYTLNISEYKRR